MILVNAYITKYNPSLANTIENFNALLKDAKAKHREEEQKYQVNNMVRLVSGHAQKSKLKCYSIAAVISDGWFEFSYKLRLHSGIVKAFNDCVDEHYTNGEVPEDFVFPSQLKS